MTEKFWVGEQKMEIFKLWLASKVTLYSYRAVDMYWVNKVKDVLNSLDNSFLIPDADVQYSMFVDELLSLIEIN